MTVTGNGKVGRRWRMREKGGNNWSGERRREIVSEGEWGGLG